MKIDKIYLNQNFTTQEEVFRFLSEELKQIGIVDESETYFKALNKREAESTTGLVDGFAIPHGKSEDIKDAAIIYIRNQQGIEWNSLDGSLITDIFALAIPAKGDSNHLDSLIAISTQLMDSKICAKLRATQDENEISAIFM